MGLSAGVRAVSSEGRRLGSRVSADKMATQTLGTPLPTPPLGRGWAFPPAALWAGSWPWASWGICPLCSTASPQG